MLTTPAGPRPRADPRAPRAHSRERHRVPRRRAGCAPRHPWGATVRSPQLLPHGGLQRSPAWRAEARDPIPGPRTGCGAGCPRRPPFPPAQPGPSPGQRRIRGRPVPSGGDLPPPGDARLPRKRDVPLLGAGPAMPPASPSPGRRDRGTGRAGEGGQLPPGSSGHGPRGGLGVPDVRGRHTAAHHPYHHELPRPPSILTAATAQRWPFPTQTPGPGCPSPLQWSPGLALRRGRSNTHLFSLGERP